MNSLRKQTFCGATISGETTAAPGSRAAKRCLFSQATRGSGDKAILWNPLFAELRLSECYKLQTRNILRIFWTKKQSVF